MVAIQRSDVEAAADALRESLALRAEQGNPTHIAQSIVGLARLALLRGDLEQAARLLGAAQGIRAAPGVASSTNEDGEEEQALVSRLRASLGSATASAHIAMGRELTQAAAVDFALGVGAAGVSGATRSHDGGRADRGDHAGRRQGS